MTKLRGRANELIGRLFALDEAMANVDAFCALLKDLNARDLSVVKPPHIGPIHMVRAGILRATIGTIMACLDPKDRRGNRAIIGQVLETLNDKTRVDLFVRPGQGSTTALQQARGSYEDLLKSDLLDHGRRLRNNAVAHILIPDTPTPTVHYEDVYDLRDVAERIVTDLFAACGRGEPNCLATRARMAEQAKVFWDTYFLGMGSA
jgi:hypothetical protein